MCLYQQKTNRQRLRQLILALAAGITFSSFIRPVYPHMNLTATDVQDAAQEGAFTVITYNIAGLPDGISAAPSPRAGNIATIGRKLNHFDIVHVQEDFNYHQQLYNEGNRHAYRSATKGPVLLGDGLNTLSRYPIRFFERIAWKDCAFADCLTPKGFTRSRIEIAAGVFIDFYNVHATASNHPASVAARNRNLRQLSAYITKHSAEQALIIMGDLNAHYASRRDYIRELLKTNGLKDAWIELRRSGRYPGISAIPPAADKLSLTDTCESIDKILFRSSYRLDLEGYDYHINKLFMNDARQPLSDHCPVTLRFSWKIK